jgi:DNA-binding winged helix-turn-helix (wHTH) protein
LADTVRFGEFEFDAGSGELRRHDGGEGQRLPPQPARLLQLLADRGGAIVTREEIRERLWPDTHVDFDASLHFCVRQLRTALGDSGTEPRYVQNVPRRGYRLVPEVIRADARARSVARPMPQTPRVRIAIMPFQSSIAEWVLEDLSTIAGESAAIVGPTTTSAYAGSDLDLRRLAADYGVDYIVNGRELKASGGPRMLAELIRASDGVHVWVRPYEDLSDGRRVGQEISRHVARVLQLR